jgi:hypothetical protein
MRRSRRARVVLSITGLLAVAAVAGPAAAQSATAKPKPLHLPSVEKLVDAAVKALARGDAPTIRRMAKLDALGEVEQRAVERALTRLRAEHIAPASLRVQRRVCEKAKPASDPPDPADLLAADVTTCEIAATAAGRRLALTFHADRVADGWALTGEVGVRLLDGAGRWQDLAADDQPAAPTDDDSGFE